MKKILFILSLLVLTATAVNAQSESEGEFVKKRYNPETGQSGNRGRNIGATRKENNFELSIGPRIGGGLAFMSQSDGLKIAKGSGFGFDAGVGANVRFGGKDGKGRSLNGRGLIGVGLEVNYAYRSLGTEADANLNLTNLEIPVLLQIYPGFKTKQLRNLYIEVGPTFSMILSSSPEILKQKYEWYHTGNFKGGDLKLTVGAGYRFSKNANSGFYLNLRYNQGFSKLAGNFPAKVNGAEITIGYLFKCAGGSKTVKDNKDSNDNKLNKIQF